MANVLPEDREARLHAAVASAHEALCLARREAEGAVHDRARLRWVALGLVSALQGALVAALSVYETAGVNAVQDPAHPERLAPVALLLRRARSTEFLEPPEQIALSGSQQRALERVIGVRHAAVHALAVEVPESFAEDAQVTAGLIRRLIEGAGGNLPVLRALAAAELDALQAALAAV